MLASALKTRGLRSIQAPCIVTEIVPPAAREKDILMRVAASHYPWIVFTSANGVRHFIKLWRRNRLTPKVPADTSIAVVGPATAASFEKAFGRSAALCPGEFVSEALGNSFAGQDLKGKRVLIVGAKESSPALARGLEREGALITKLTVYETRRVALAPKIRKRILEASPQDLIVTFFSPSAVRAFLSALRAAPGFLSKLRIVSVGPVTSNEILSCGLRVHAQAAQHTEAGVVKVIEGLSR